MRRTEAKRLFQAFPNARKLRLCASHNGGRGTALAVDEGPCNAWVRGTPSGSFAPLEDDSEGGAAWDLGEDDASYRSIYPSSVKRSVVAFATFPHYAKNDAASSCIGEGLYKCVFCAVWI